jgi:nondiscriminating glutamyl-tRNA synthetase
MIRVRFAPSPTGFLHVGGARTALFNWLYARHTGGTFVLRIEDTDLARSTKESEQSLLEDLAWLGLDWDEGPVKGGSFAPYRQSERLDIYREEAAKLIAGGMAYSCFCTDEELERNREEALARGDSPHYNGTCRELTREEIAKKRGAGLPEVVRFRVPEGDVTIDDEIRGTVTLATSMVGDFVLIRSNGQPTYNFAASVDDRLMEITHVLRGEEHLPNTLRQGLLYRAFKAEPPRFGHLPLIHGEDHSKLSKRHGASSVSELRAQGFLPQAAINYLALLGWSHSGEREVLSSADLIADFALERVSKSPAIFDMTKLRWLNGMHIRDTAPDELFPVADQFFGGEITDGYSSEQRREIFKLLQQKIDVFSDLQNFSNTFSPDVVIEDEAREALGWGGSRAVLGAFTEELRAGGGAISLESIKAAIKAAGKTSGAKGKELYFPIRAAVTGSVHGPDLAGVIAVKGIDAVLTLLEKELRSE